MKASSRRGARCAARGSAVPLALVAALATALSVGPQASASAASSPYPLTLQATAGLLFSKQDTFIARSTALDAVQDRDVALVSSAGTTRWGVLNPPCGATQYPVRSLDAGHSWSVEGPALATDWAGGSLYCATATIAVSASEVIYVSDSVIDVSTDVGRHWYQYVWAADDWSMTRHVFTDGTIGLRVGPDRWAAGSSMPVHSYALYRYQVAAHRWRRVAESLS